MRDLFAEHPSPMRPKEPLAKDAVLLHGFLREEAEEIYRHIQSIAAASPFRHLVTPGGRTMSVAMTNCGALGWVSDRAGYRYTAQDPLSGKPWPEMPALFRDIAARAAAEAGFADFAPDACLINRYIPGARLTLHCDDNERDTDAPIVSVSLGLPAVFLFGGLERSDKTTRHRLEHGDVAVWGGASRMCYHGVMPLAEGEHPLTGQQRLNITFRKVLLRHARRVV